jgi:hypothetical protein
MVEERGRVHDVDGMNQHVLGARREMLRCPGYRCIRRVREIGTDDDPVDARRTGGRCAASR